MSRRILAVLIGCLFLLTACAEDERRELRLTRTSTAEAGVRILADNCPGPSSVSMSIRNDLLWEIQVASTSVDGADTSAEVETNEPALSKPGLIEFVVGQTPDGWETVTPFTETVEPGIRYTIETQPDGQTIDFSTPDLQAGLLWDGVGVIQFNPNLINEECGTTADIGAFATNLAVLLALGTTAAAIVLVVLILILFVITSRFSRVKSIQKKLARESERNAQGPGEQ